MDSSNASGQENQLLNDSKEKIDFFLLSAHEIRTSLSAMKWLFKMLEDGDYGPLTPEQGAVIEQVTRSNEQMIVLLNNTMDSIKNNGVITFAKFPIHLAHLIAESVKEFTDEAAQKHVAFSYHQSAAPVIVIGDEAKLRIAFHNIIENAIKYSKPDTEVLISITTEASQAIVQVQDHGIGVPQDQVNHLFERFFRAGNSKEAGTGLGLYSTKFIIERHGGTIAMVSEEGKGTTVTIALPLQA